MRKIALVILISCLYLITDAQVSGRCAHCPPSPTSQNGKVLSSNGTNFQWATPSSSEIYDGNGITLSNDSVNLGGSLNMETEIDLNSNNIVFTGIGNVGIGTATPIEKLNSFGSFLAEDWAGIGKHFFISVNTEEHPNGAALNYVDTIKGIRNAIGTGDPYNDLSSNVSIMTMQSQAGDYASFVAAWDSVTLKPFALISVAGAVSGGTLNIFDSISIFNSPIAIVDGTEGVGKVLISDANGNASWQTKIKSNSFSQVGTATTTFTVTIGETMASSNYRVNVTPTAALSAALFYVTNKTTTTFDVMYLAGLTGTVTFDWTVSQ